MDNSPTNTMDNTFLIEQISKQKEEIANQREEIEKQKAKLEEYEHQISLLKEQLQSHIKKEDELLRINFDMQYKYESDLLKDDKPKFSKLHFAAQTNAIIIAEQLILEGADVNELDIICQNIIILFLINAI